MIFLGLLGGFFVARRVRACRRDDRATRTIMGGDLSERLPVGSSGDELDRLAHNLNEMLDRIEALMGGLKEVSDNIAHDLKTPLTRMRNRAEEALRSSHGEADYRAALETTLDESDSLIKTFNALLMIARAEADRREAIWWSSTRPKPRAASANSTNRWPKSRASRLRFRRPRR